MITFVTGGTSSIGRVLVQALAAKGEHVRVLVRPTSDRRGLELPGVEFVQGDVTDLFALRRGMQGCQQVCHLAAVVAGGVIEGEWWRVNREGSRNVLQAALDQKISSVVQVSTLSVLGPTAPGETADETRPVDTTRYFNLYQKTKRAADEIAWDFASRGLNVMIVYPGFGFGCSHASSHTSLQEQTLLRLASGKPVAIMGEGQNQLCLSYYMDTVQGIFLALERGKRGEGYILGGENLTFVEIWAAIAQTLGKKPPELRAPISLIKTVSGFKKLLTGQPIFPQEFLDMVTYNWCFSSKKALRELGWQPRPFRQAMMETWQDYQLAGYRMKA
jgi:nucleoside-diphosphate-sugar epimerase